MAEMIATAGAVEPADGDAPGWDGIDDVEIKGLMEAKGYRAYPDVAKAYFHLNKMTKGSPDVVAIPKDNDAEGWARLYKALGRPDNADNYDFSLPDGAQIDEDFSKNAKAWFHAAGMSSKQASAFANAYQKYAIERVAGAQEAARRDDEAKIAEIRKTFGKGFEAALERGKVAVKSLGLEDALLDDLEAQMGAPAVMKLITTLGERIGREDVRLEGISRDGFGQSKAELVSRRDAMKANSEIVRALTDTRDPNYARYKHEWDGIVDKLSRT